MSRAIGCQWSLNFDGYGSILTSCFFISREAVGGAGETLPPPPSHLLLEVLNNE